MVSGPSADGVPFSTLTVIVELPGIAFAVEPSVPVARITIHLPGCASLTNEAVIASAAISDSVASRVGSFLPSADNETVLITAFGLIAWSKRTRMSASLLTTWFCGTICSTFGGGVLNVQVKSF